MFPSVKGLDDLKSSKRIDELSDGKSLIARFDYKKESKESFRRDNVLVSCVLLKAAHSVALGFFVPLGIWSRRKNDSVAIVQLHNGTFFASP